MSNGECPSISLLRSFLPPDCLRALDNRSVSIKAFKFAVKRKTGKAIDSQAIRLARAGKTVGYLRIAERFGYRGEA